VKDTYLLITNLDQVWVKDTTRTFSHALLLAHYRFSPNEWVNRIQGYTFDAPCFDLDLASDSELNAVKPEVPYGNPEKDTPLLEVARTERRWMDLVYGEMRLRLIKHDPSRGFEVQQFEEMGPVEGAIKRGVAKYWPHPEIPVREFVNADRMRAHFKAADEIFDFSGNPKPQVGAV